MSQSTTVHEETPPTRCLTINEICANLRVSRNTVNRWIQAGRLTVLKMDNSQQGAVRVTEESYERFLREQTVEAAG